MININGKSYSGNNVTIKNNKIYIDGVNQTPVNDKVINITVDGNISKLDVDECEQIIVHGDCSKVSTMSGDVKCGNVTGNVKTMSGDVECGNVGGDVETMSGDIDYTTDRPDDDEILTRHPHNTHPA